MKKLLLFLFILMLLIPKQASAQSDGAAIAAAAIGAGIIIGSGIAAVEQMKEQAELTATEWVLTNHPELTSFSLETLDFTGKKVKDMSSVSVITFKIQEFTPAMKPILDGKKKILFGFTSNGWINEYGINFSKIRWYLLDATDWMNMMTAYVKVASDEKDDTFIRQTLENGKVYNYGIKIKSKLIIPFFKLGGDMYVVSNYSPDMKFIYNEKTLGIYLKETMDLVQISRKTLIDIHKYFFEEG